jgi:hypothetical protein
MARRFASFVTMLLLIAGAAAAPGPNDAAIEQAKTSAQSFLALIDGREYDESWKAASKLVQAAVTQEEWTAKLSFTLGPLGSKTSRGVKSSEFRTTMPGAPDGEYVLLQYDTAFENKKAAVETVTLMKESDGLWRVAGYFIR